MSKRALSIALGMVLMAAASTVAAQSGVQAPRASVGQLAYRGEPDEVQAPRGESGDIQAPRGEPEEIQAPRGSVVALSQP
jgi:hypothetical protein